MTQPGTDVLTPRGWVGPERAADRLLVSDQSIEVRLGGLRRTIAVDEVTDAVVWRAADGVRRVRLLGTDGKALLTLADDSWVTASGRTAEVLTAHGHRVRTVDAEEGRTTGVSTDPRQSQVQELEQLAGGRGPQGGVVAVVAAVSTWLVVVVAGVTESRTAYSRWLLLAALLCLVQLVSTVLSRRHEDAGRRELAALPDLGPVDLATGPASLHADAGVLAVLAGDRSAVLPRAGSAAVTGVAAEGTDLLLAGAGGVPLARLRCASPESADDAAGRLASAGLDRLPTASRGGEDLSDPRQPRPRGAWLLPVVAAFPLVLLAVAGLVFDRAVEPSPVPLVVGALGALFVLATGLLRTLRPPAHGWAPSTGSGVPVLLPLALVLYTLALAGPLRQQLPRGAVVAYLVVVVALGVASLVAQTVLVARRSGLAVSPPLLAFPALTTSVGVGLLVADRGGSAPVLAVLTLPLAVVLGVVGARRAGGA